MKNLLIKTLFISLLLSSVISSKTQTNQHSEEIKNRMLKKNLDSNFLSKKITILENKWNKNKWIRYSTYCGIVFLAAAAGSATGVLATKSIVKKAAKEETEEVKKATKILVTGVLAIQQETLKPTKEAMSVIKKETLKAITSIKKEGLKTNKIVKQAIIDGLRAITQGKVSD